MLDALAFGFVLFFVFRFARGIGWWSFACVVLGFLLLEGAWVVFLFSDHDTDTLSALLLIVALLVFALALGCSRGYWDGHGVPAPPRRRYLSGPVPPLRDRPPPDPHETFKPWRPRDG